MTEDLRVMRTKKSIETAFAGLVNEKGFANVTVKEIAEKAIINRQTFYNYYQDKYDLTEQLNNKYIAMFNRFLAVRFKNIQVENQPLPLLSDLYKSKEYSTLWESRDTITALLSIQYDQNSFTARLQRSFVDQIQKHLTIEFTNLDISVIGSFYIDMISFIAKNNTKPTDEDLSKLRQLLAALIK